MKVFHLFCFGRRLAVFALCLLLAVPLFVYAADPEQWLVEGIVYEEQNPGSSMIVINGTILTEGEQYRNVRIDKIEEGRALITDLDTGKTGTLFVTGGRVAPAQAASAVSPAAGPAKVEPPSKKRKSVSFFEMISEVFHAVKDMRVILAMRRIYTAVNVYTAQHGPAGGLCVEKLAEEGLIPRPFKEGARHGYRYELKRTEKGYQVIASPEQSEKGRYFLMDDDGVLYVEKDKPATRDSKEYDSAGFLGKMTGAMSAALPD